MTKYWTENIFGTRKPIIAMCHLNALPGDPYFDHKGGMDSVIEWARKDFLALQNGGVDAVMFSNEFSLPYLTKVETVTTTAMARVIGELMPEIRIPFGVNVLWDPTASLDLAVSVGAKNKFGHPSAEVVERLEGVTGSDGVFVTAEDGTIEFITDGQKLWVNTER